MNNDGIGFHPFEVDDSEQPYGCLVLHPVFFIGGGMARLPLRFRKPRRSGQSLPIFGAHIIVMIVVYGLPYVVDSLERLDIKVFEMMKALHDELMLGEIAHAVLNQQALAILQELFEFAAYHAVVPSSLHDITPAPVRHGDISRVIPAPCPIDRSGQHCYDVGRSHRAGHWQAVRRQNPRMWG